jgi:hypothetical protein
MSVPFLQVSRDAAQALTEFSDEFKDALALGAFETWAAENGLVRSTDALKTIFPIPLSAAGYHEFKGDMKYRSLYDRSLQMKSKQWQDGVEEFAAVIEAPEFIDWAGEPARMAQEWMRLPNSIVMTLLESGSGANGPVLDFYTDRDSSTVGTRQLFATDHPFNVLSSGVGSWDNTMSTTRADIQSGHFFDLLNERFRSIKGPNGKPLGIKMAGGRFLVHPHDENTFKKALELDTLIRAVKNDGTLDGTSSIVAAVGQANIWAKQMSYTVTDESSQDTVFYAIAAGKPGLYPWVVQQGTVEEIVQDKSDAKYKETLKVSISEIGKANAAACLPHRIIKVTITG